MCVDVDITSHDAERIDTHTHPLLREVKCRYLLGSAPALRRCSFLVFESHTPHAGDSPSPLPARAQVAKYSIFLERYLSRIVCSRALPVHVRSSALLGDSFFVPRDEGGADRRGLQLRGEVPGHHAFQPQREEGALCWLFSHSLVASVVVVISCCCRRR